MRSNPSGAVRAGTDLPARFFRLACAFVLLSTALSSWSGPFRWTPEEPDLDRWVYPFNFEPGVRKVAPTYGSFDPRFDTRDAQFLLGWETGGIVATNAGPTRYLIDRVRVTLTSIAPNEPVRPFVYDPTFDAFQTYQTNQPGYVPDSDPGRPIELYGAGFRNGYDEFTFLEKSPFGVLGPIAGGNISIGTRNAYAAAFDEDGRLIDIANNVGQLNPAWTNAPFEVQPWAIGTTTNAAPGEEMPDDGKMSFDVDLRNPLVVGYLQRALDLGKLRLFVSCLSPAGQSTPGGVGIGGGGAYPWWSTRESLLYDPPRLELEGTLIGPDDTDQDGLPDDWERYWWGDLAPGAADDPDGDRVDNSREWLGGTNPRDATSVLAIADFRSLDGRPVLRFRPAPSRVYSVEFSRDLVVWETVPGRVIYPEVGWAEWSGSDAAGGSPGYFRLRAE